MATLFQNAPSRLLTPEFQYVPMDEPPISKISKYEPFQIWSKLRTQFLENIHQHPPTAFHSSLLASFFGAKPGSQTCMALSTCCCASEDCRPPMFWKKEPSIDDLRAVWNVWILINTTYTAQKTVSYTYSGSYSKNVPCKYGILVYIWAQFWMVWG